MKEGWKMGIKLASRNTRSNVDSATWNLYAMLSIINDHCESEDRLVIRVVAISESNRRSYLSTN